MGLWCSTIVTYKIAFVGKSTIGEQWSRHLLFENLINIILIDLITNNVTEKLAGFLLKDPDDFYPNNVSVLNCNNEYL